MCKTHRQFTQSHLIEVKSLIIVLIHGISTSCLLVPVLDIFIIVKVLAPFDQVFYLIIELFIIHFHELVVIEWVVIELLKLLLESS